MSRELGAALFLFDNNEDKAKLFLEMLKGASYGIPTKYDVIMDFSEPTCRWCDKGECWFFMPDSRFKCEHNKKECSFYENREESTNEDIQSRQGTYKT